MLQKPFGNRFRVSGSKIDFCESDLKNKWQKINELKNMIDFR